MQSLSHRLVRIKPDYICSFIETLSDIQRNRILLHKEIFLYSLKILSQTLKVFTLVIFSKFKVIAKIYRSVNSKTAKTDFMIDHVDTHQMVTGTTIIPARNLSLVLSGSEPSENELSLYVDYKG